MARNCTCGAAFSHKEARLLATTMKHLEVVRGSETIPRVRRKYKNFGRQLRKLLKRSASPTTTLKPVLNMADRLKIVHPDYPVPKMRPGTPATVQSVHTGDLQLHSSRQRTSSSSLAKPVYFAAWMWSAVRNLPAAIQLDAHRHHLPNKDLGRSGRQAGERFHTMTEGRKEVDEALRELLRSGAYSDLTIKCGKYTFAVHKAIMCTRSAFFAAACKPGTFKEGTCGVIELDAASDDDDDIGSDDPEAIKLMIDFLYTHTYAATDVTVTEDQANEGLSTSRTRLTPSGDCNTIMHAKMYGLANKYSINSLNTVALGKFTEAVTYAWNHDDFPQALRLCYTATPDSDKGLRDVASNAVLDHSAVLLRKMEIEDSVRGISGLAYDLLQRKSSQRTSSDGPICGTCGEAFAAKQCYNCNHYMIQVGCGCDRTRTACTVCRW